MPRPPGPFEARQRAHGACRPPPARVVGASPLASRRLLRDTRWGPRAERPCSGLGSRRRSFWPSADGCPPFGTSLGLPSRRPVDSAPRGRPMPCRPAPPPRHRRVPDARGRRTPTRPCPHAAAAPAVRRPRVGRWPAASCRSHRAVGPRAVRRGVPGITAAKGRAPSSHVLVGCRLPVASAVTALRARPGAQRDREGPHGLSPPTPPARRVTDSGGAVESVRVSHHPHQSLGSRRASQECIPGASSTPRRMRSPGSTSGDDSSPPFRPAAHPRGGLAYPVPRLAAVGGLTSVAGAGPVGSAEARAEARLRPPRKRHVRFARRPRSRRRGVWPRVQGRQPRDQAHQPPLTPETPRRAGSPPRTAPSRVGV